MDSGDRWTGEPPRHIPVVARVAARVRPLPALLLLAAAASSGSALASPGAAGCAALKTVAIPNTVITKTE